MTVSISAPLLVNELTYVDNLVTVTFTLNAVRGVNTTINWSTLLNPNDPEVQLFGARPGLIEQNQDFLAVQNGTATILAGQLSTTAQVRINADNSPETNETFRVYINSANDLVGVREATVTIVDDDAPNLFPNARGIYDLTQTAVVNGKTTAQGDRVFMGIFDDVLFAGAGDDVVHAGGGNDIVLADDGDDVVYGDDGNDSINAGDGDDIVYGGLGVDIIFGLDGQDTIFGEDGNDIILGGRGGDNIDGGVGNDQIDGSGPQVLYQSPVGVVPDTYDILRGGAGNDVIDGRDGNDLIYGGTESDIISVGLALSTPNRQADQDLVVFTDRLDQGDSIFNWVPGEDGVDLTPYFDKTGYTGTTPVTDGVMALFQNGANVDVYLYDTPGNFNSAFLAFSLMNLSTAQINVASDFLIQ